MFSLHWLEISARDTAKHHLRGNFWRSSTDGFQLKRRLGCTVGDAWIDHREGALRGDFLFLNLGE